MSRFYSPSITIMVDLEENRLEDSKQLGATTKRHSRCLKINLNKNPPRTLVPLMLLVGLKNAVIYDTVLHNISNFDFRLQLNIGLMKPLLLSPLAQQNPHSLLLYVLYLMHYSKLIDFLHE